MRLPDEEESMESRELINRMCEGETAINIIKEVAFKEAAPRIKTKGFPEKFWIVVNPTKTQVVEDVLIECDVHSFSSRIKEGLDTSRIYGIYGDPTSAKKDAHRLVGSR